jgi:hypothetical protein
MRLFD